jgi:Protein of unknown function (DUF2510)
MSAPIPPSWHPDPEYPTMLRWWDGTQWTNDRRPIPVPPPPGQQAQSPPPLGYAVSPGSAPNMFYVQPGVPGAYSSPAPQGAQTSATQSGSTNQKRNYQTRGRTRGPNSFSWTAIGFAAAYLVIAATTSFVLLGIVPVMSAIRAFQRGEKLAPVAAIAAVVTVGSAIFFLTGGHR